MALSSDPWTQLCASDSCGLSSTIALECAQLGVPRSGATVSALSCPADSVIETIYMHWDQFGIQSMDSVDCRRVPPPSHPLHAEPAEI